MIIVLHQYEGKVKHSITKFEITGRATVGYGEVPLSVTSDRWTTQAGFTMPPSGSQQNCPRCTWSWSGWWWWCSWPDDVGYDDGWMTCWQNELNLCIVFFMRSFKVVMRDKGERSSQSSQNRQSLQVLIIWTSFKMEIFFFQLSPSTTPVRPPRRKRPESASYESASNSNLYSSSNNINSKTSNLYSSNNNINKSSNLYSSSNNIHNKSFESYSSNSRRETGSLQRGEVSLYFVQKTKVMESNVMMTIVMLKVLRMMMRQMINVAALTLLTVRKH